MFFNLHDVNIDIYFSMGSHGQHEGFQLPEGGERNVGASETQARAKRDQ